MAQELNEDYFGSTQRFSPDREEMQTLQQQITQSQSSSSADSDFVDIDPGEQHQPHSPPRVDNDDIDQQQQLLITESPVAAREMSSQDDPYLNSTQQFNIISSGNGGTEDESTFAVPQTQPFSQLPQNFLEGTQPFSIAEADQIIDNKIDYLLLSSDNQAGETGGPFGGETSSRFNSTQPFEVSVNNTQSQIIEDTFSEGFHPVEMLIPGTQGSFTNYVTQTWPFEMIPERPLGIDLNDSQGGGTLTEESSAEEDTFDREISDFPASPPPEGAEEALELEGRGIDDEIQEGTLEIPPKSPSDESDFGGNFEPPEGPQSPTEDTENQEEENIEKPAVSRRRVIVSDDEGEEEQQTETGVAEEELGVQGVEAEADENKSEVGELIADIFGDSEGEGAPGSDDEGRGRKVPEAGREETVGTEDADEDRRPTDFEWDFDVMLRKKKLENKKRRKRRRDGTVDLLSDADEQIKDLVFAMKEAAEHDRRLNSTREPALNKRKMLPYVVAQLRKADLQEAYVDFGVVEALSEWLAPLPDKSLPSLEVRTNLLKILTQFPKLDQSILRRSGIGKAAMLLFKHPKETKQNRGMAGKLISEWSRPIFELDTDYRALSKKEREERDYQNMPSAKKRRLSLETEESKQDSRNDDEELPLRPGDKGWIGRARVPQPSTKDYVVRPKWKVEGQFRGATNKKQSAAYDKKLREFKDKTKRNKHQHAVNVSLSGKKMAY